MNDIDWYMDRAREKAGLSSDRQLAKALGLSPMGTSSWRTRRAWPEDERMVELCKLAEVDPRHGLLDLMSWRTKENGVAAEVWQSIKAALKLVPLLFVLIWGKPAQIQAQTLQASGTAHVSSLYIMSVIE